MFAGTFAPVGWVVCDGSLLPIADNDALFTLLGTTYGGDGQSTFGVPDLRGRVPMHVSGSFPIGTTGGSETTTLTSANLPSHTHLAQCKSVPGTAALPTGNYPAGNKLKSDGTAFDNIYADTGAQTMLAATVSSVGASLPHNNVQPFVVVNYILATSGIYPSQG